MAVKLKGQDIAELPETKVIKVAGEKAEVDRLYTLDDIDPLGRGEYLFYGAPGSGKTCTAFTLPGPYRVIDADGGLKSVRWAFTAGKTAIKKLTDVVAYRPFEKNSRGGYVKAPEAFDRMTDMTDNWFGEDVENWDTLIVDSCTEINEWVLNKGLEFNSRPLLGGSKTLSRSHGVNVKAEARILTGQQDYKSAQALFETWLQDLRVNCAIHGKNLVLICHEWIEKDEMDNGSTIIVAILPWLIGQLRARISKDFDDVWYFAMDKASGEPRIQLKGDGKRIAKSRFGDIFNRYEIPDYREIIKTVEAFHKSK